MLSPVGAVVKLDVLVPESIMVPLQHPTPIPQMELFFVLRENFI
jgi:hypothetical protein